MGGDVPVHGPDERRRHVESREEADVRFCQEFCVSGKDRKLGDPCGLGPMSPVPPFECGMSVEYKLAVMERERGGKRSKPWFPEYEAKLKRRF